MSRERGQWSRVRAKWDLVVSLIKINLLKSLHLLRSDTTSSMVLMTCRSLTIALLRERMSTQILISFGFHGLGTTSIAKNQGVRPSARSMMSSLSSCLSLSTCFVTWNGMRRCGCATYLTDLSTCMRTSSPLYSPIPLSRLEKSLRKSGTAGGRSAGGCSTALTALMRFNFCDVIQLST